MGGRTITVSVSIAVTIALGLMVYLQGIPVGGTQALGQGQSWSVDVPAGISRGKFWGQTGFSFDASGKGSCNTGDYGGLLSCQPAGQNPATLAEYSLNGANNRDLYDIHLVDGFNLPLSITPSDSSCPTVDCSSNITASYPTELKVVDACDSACVALNTPQDCYTGNYANNCPPTKYSKFFKGKCPQAYSYAKDDNTSPSTCSSGTNYNIAFCA